MWGVLLLRQIEAPGSDHWSGIDGGGASSERLRHLMASADETMVPRVGRPLRAGFVAVRRCQQTRTVMAADDDVAKLVGSRSRRDQQQRGQKCL